MKFLQLSAVEEGFQADLLDAVELVQGLVLDEGSGQFCVHFGAVMLEFVDAGLDEADQVGHFGGVAAVDIRADYVAKNGAPSAAAPKIIFRYYFVDSSTGVKSQEMLAECKWAAAGAEDPGEGD